MKRAKFSQIREGTLVPELLEMRPETAPHSHCLANIQIEKKEQNREGANFVLFVKSIPIRIDLCFMALTDHHDVSCSDFDSQNRQGFLSV